jgi:hypothetical protein
MADYAARRGSARLPIKAAVRVRFPGVEEPYEGTVRDIGMAGMFIAGGAPMPAGTLMHFEFRPSEQWHVLRGRGRVVWARQRPNAAGEPAGMGVRFIELDERGRRGVRWLIETYQAVGDKPFETWSVPPQFTRSPPTEGDDLATQEIEPLAPAPAVEAKSRKPWLQLAAGLVGIALVGWLLLGRGGGTEDPANPPAAPAPQVVATSPTPAVPTATPPPAAEPPASDATAMPPESARPAPVALAEDATASEPRQAADAEAVGPILSSLVDEWAAAWSSQDIDRYLAFYAPEFVPDGGMSRSAWARQREDRLNRPAYIRVTAEGVQVLDQASDTPRTVFTQIYASDTFSDQVTKSLTWARSEGSWRIVSERAAP